jgi:gluconolactonase
MQASRRNFIAGTTSLIAGSALVGCQSAPAKTAPAAPPISADQIDVVGQGALGCEGIVLDRDGNVFGAGNGNRIVYKVDQAGRLHELFTLPPAATPSGLTMDRQGNLIVCDSGSHSILRIDQAGKIGVLAQRSTTLPLTTPNFPTFDAEGNLFVSISTSFDSPGQALQAGEFTTPMPNGRLVRIRPDGRSDTVATGLRWANGTAIDPKEEAVYVLESTRRDLLRIPLKKDGTFGKVEVFAKDFPGMPDGMAFAEDGTLFVTVPGTMGPTMTILNQILKVERDGSWSVFVQDTTSAKLTFPTNCAFGGPGGKDLYIANSQGDHFSRVRTSFTGHRLYHQR